MYCRFRPLFFSLYLLVFAFNGHAQPQLTAGLPPQHRGQVVSTGIYEANAIPRKPGSGSESRRSATRYEFLTKYEQTCATRFFEFCDYLLTPPDIIIDSLSYSAGQKKEDVVMQRERADDTARIKKAVLRYTVEPVSTITTDSLHFSQNEMSDQAYRKLEIAFASMEKFLDTCYNNGGLPLKLVPLRLRDNAFVRSQVKPGQLAQTFLLQRGRRTLAVLVFTPQSRMTESSPPRICGWSVNFQHGRMIFHNLSGVGAPVAANR